MNTLLSVSTNRVTGANSLPGLSLLEIAGDETDGLTEVLAQLALIDSFDILPGDEWLPDHDTLRRAVRRHTTAVHESLGRIKLRRCDTCLKLEDLLSTAQPSGSLLLISNFLHHFYNTDFDLSLRWRVLQQCCGHLKRLSLVRPVAVLVQHMPSEEYEDFFAVIAGAADEVIQLKEISAARASQLDLFEGADG